MRIALTGAHGFIGSWLASELRGRGHRVEQSPDPGVTGWDLTKPGAIGHWLYPLDELDTIVHCAAIVGRAPGELFPIRTIEVNSGLTASLAKGAAKNGLRFVYISTSEAANPLNTYGLSKRWGEEAAWFNHPSPIVCRLYMPYGPGYPPGEGRGAITNFLWNALHGDPLIVHENASRSYCWIGDTVRAIADVTEGAEGITWNIGRGDQEFPMVQIARWAIEMAGSESKIVLVPKPDGFQSFKRPSFAKLWATGWRPKIHLYEGMEKTLTWLKELDKREEKCPDSLSFSPGSYSLSLLRESRGQTPRPTTSPWEPMET